MNELGGFTMRLPAENIPEIAAPAVHRGKVVGGVRAPTMMPVANAVANRSAGYVQLPVWGLCDIFRPRIARVSFPGIYIDTVARECITFCPLVVNSEGYQSYIDRCASSLTATTFLLPFYGCLFSFL
jgi:hypothetical protein